MIDFILLILSIFLLIGWSLPNPNASDFIRSDHDD
mgnify:CR=1 FL=1